MKYLALQYKPSININNNYNNQYTAQKLVFKDNNEYPLVKDLTSNKCVLTNINANTHNSHTSEIYTPSINRYKQSSNENTTNMY